MRTAQSMAGMLALLALTACGSEDVAAPTAVDPSLLTTSMAKGAKQQGEVYEPARYIQTRVYGAGTLPDGAGAEAPTMTRQCLLNSYEDLDGNDFVVVDPAGAYHKEHVNEPNGFVMLKQLVGVGFPSEVTHIGRAAWNAEFWTDSPYVGDPNGHVTSANSLAQGVMFEVPRDAAGNVTDPDVAELLEWFNETEAEPGSWSRDGTGAFIPGKPGVGYDLLNDPLGIIPLDPDPSKVGTEGRAVARIDELLRRYQDSLTGIECDADYALVGFDTLGQPIYSAHFNDIRLEKNWPRELKRYFR